MRKRKKVKVSSLAGYGKLAGGREGMWKSKAVCKGEIVLGVF